MPKRLIQLVRPREPINPRYADDVAKLKTMLNSAGYNADEVDIEWAWKLHSIGWCAGWLSLDGRSVVDCVKYILENLTPVK